MRTLVRWSDSSLSMTTPRPEKAEPSRRMPGSFCHRLLRLCLEVAIVDRLEARILNAQEFETALHGDDFGGGFRPHVTIGMQAQFADSGLLDAADAGNQSEPLGQPGAVSLDIDDITAAQNLTAEIGHRAHQGNLAGIEQRDAVANALHSFQQV